MIFVKGHYKKLAILVVGSVLIIVLIISYDLSYPSAYETLLKEEQRISKIKPYGKSNIVSYSGNLYANEGSGEFYILNCRELIRVDGDVIKARTYYQGLSKVTPPSQIQDEIPTVSSYSDSKYLVIWERLEVSYDGKIEGTEY